MIFRARQFEFRFPRPALVMGIVNVTPDSFSDGGKFLDADAAVAHALKLVDEGAEILDIGGESTRPGAKPVSEKEELRRVIPVIEKIAKQFHSRWGETPSSSNQKIPKQNQGSTESRPTKKILISIDTMKPAVARAALAAGASIVNDVAANRRDDAMWKIVAEYRAGYICMHAQGSPQTMQKNPAYKNVVREVGEFFSERLKKLNAAGVSDDQVVIDPGIGFGKTLEHNLQLLAGLRRFKKLSRPVLLGVSRKSFIEKISGATLNERLPASLACATLAIESGVQIVRAHDVRATLQAVRMTEAILSQNKNVV
jgi:dihydropteroate synthase